MHLSEPINVHVRQGHAQSTAQFPHVVDETLAPINPTAFLEQRLAEKSREYCGRQVRFCWEIHVDRADGNSTCRGLPSIE